jgi:hypothetical protein
MCKPNLILQEQGSYMANNHFVLVSGASTTGKSTSLMYIDKPEGVMHLNCDPQRLPFNAKFKIFDIEDPLQVNEAFLVAETMPDIHTIVIDTATYLFDMYESQYVITAVNGQQAWGEFAQFIKQLFQYYVNRSTKNVIVLAHTLGIYNEATLEMETKVPVKGSAKNTGIESFFSNVISTKKMSLVKLKDYANPLLLITEDDEMLGYKHVFQTRLTKETVGERIRSPMGMWDKSETFIDNNIQNVIDRLHKYYE